MRHSTRTALQTKKLVDLTVDLPVSVRCILTLFVRNSWRCSMCTPSFIYPPTVYSPFSWALPMINHPALSIIFRFLRLCFIWLLVVSCCLDMPDLTRRKQLRSRSFFILTFYFRQDGEYNYADHRRYLSLLTYVSVYFHILFVSGGHLYCNIPIIFFQHGIIFVAIGDR